MQVEASALSGFTFDQFRASIRGSIRFVGATQPVTIQLSSSVQPLQMVVSNGYFEFNQILPGRYTVSVLQDAWCWTSKSLDVEVVDGDVEDVVFEQLGFLLTVVTSHDVDVTYALDGQVRGTLSLLSGSSKHCLHQDGLYTLKPKSCHVFDPASVEWSTDQLSTIVLKPVKHRVGVVVTSDHVIEDLTVSATSPSGLVVPLALHVLEESSGDQFRHRFFFDAAAGDTFDIVPSADSLLFFPSTLSLTVKDQCDDNAGSIVAQKVLY